MEEVIFEWRWIDEQGRAMTDWKKGDPPPTLDVSDDRGTMSVEVRLAGDRHD